jgi:hypothetical protein
LNSRPLPYQGSALPLSYNGWSSPGTYRTLHGAEDEVRTRDLQLGRLSLYQLSYFRFSTRRPLLRREPQPNQTPRFGASRRYGTSDSWARMDSNHRTRKRTDLQSVAVGHLATCPYTRGISPLLSQRRDSNPRPADYKSAALPTELLWLVTQPTLTL